jgi:predicted RNase H-like nuclease (RuvC/YqgF family)
VKTKRTTGQRIVGVPIKGSVGEWMTSSEELAAMKREAKRIDRAIARKRSKAREEVLQQFTAHARNLRAALHGNKDIHAVEHWRQCIESFEREMKSAGKSAEP